MALEERIVGVWKYDTLIYDNKNYLDSLKNKEMRIIYYFFSKLGEYEVEDGDPKYTTYWRKRDLRIDFITKNDTLKKLLANGSLEENVFLKYFNLITKY
jgi:Asp-tRNA(Asn)/Glu-tRNA(Gln) amidotransferase C subunit